MLKAKLTDFVDGEANVQNAFAPGTSGTKQFVGQTLELYGTTWYFIGTATEAQAALLEQRLAGIHLGEVLWTPFNCVYVTELTQADPASKLLSDVKSANTQNKI